MEIAVVLVASELEKWPLGREVFIFYLIFGPWSARTPYKYKGDTRGAAEKN
jgi:hypothetical protein